MSKRISAQFKVVRKSEPRPRQAPLGPELGGAQATEDELCLFNTLSSEATASMVARRFLCLLVIRRRREFNWLLVCERRSGRRLVGRHRHRGGLVRLGEKSDRRRRTRDLVVFVR